jgi:hypothetical protein
LSHKLEFHAIVDPFLSSSSSSFAEVQGHSEAKRLLHDLMKDYNKHVLPVPSINYKVNVTLGLKLSQLSDIDEKNQIMTTNVWLEHVRMNIVFASLCIVVRFSLGMDGLQISVDAQSL